MNKSSAVIHYASAMAVIGQWLSEGIIGVDELTTIEAAIAEKYDLSYGSIYRHALDISGV